MHAANGSTLIVPASVLGAAFHTPKQQQLVWVGVMAEPSVAQHRCDILGLWMSMCCFLFLNDVCFGSSGLWQIVSVIWQGAAAALGCLSLILSSAHISLLDKGGIRAGYIVAAIISSSC